MDSKPVSLLRDRAEAVRQELGQMAGALARLGPEAAAVWQERDRIGSAAGTVSVVAPARLEALRAEIEKML